MITDTTRTNCQIRIAYAERGTVGPYHSSELCERIYRRADRPIAIIKATEYSDYSGGVIQASNHRVLYERFPGLIQICGSHGYHALAYDATLGPVPEWEDLTETLDSLERYCEVDDEDSCRLAEELESEAWSSHGAEDFRKAVSKCIDALDTEHEHEIPGQDEPCSLTIPDRESWGTWGTHLRSLWELGCDRLNINGGSGYTIETGCTVHFYITEWVERGVHRPMERRSADVLRALEAIAQATRVEGESS